MELGTKVKLKDGRIGYVIKQVDNNVYRIRLLNGFRTVLKDSEFDRCEK